MPQKINKKEVFHFYTNRISVLKWQKDKALRLSKVARSYREKINTESIFLIQYQIIGTKR
nr:MAG TPA: hypothetical protein [Caudoviricetes sp.]